jgi:hypothetical protein
MAACAVLGVKSGCFITPKRIKRRRGFQEGHDCKPCNSDHQQGGDAHPQFAIEEMPLRSTIQKRKSG